MGIAELIFEKVKNLPQEQIAQVLDFVDFLEQRKQSQKTAEQQAAHDAWICEQVQIGLDDLAAGRTVPHEVVQAEAARRRAETLRKLQVK